MMGNLDFLGQSAMMKDDAIARAKASAKEAFDEESVDAIAMI